MAPAAVRHGCHQALTFAGAVVLAAALLCRGPHRWRQGQQAGCSRLRSVALSMAWAPDGKTVFSRTSWASAHWSATPSERKMTRQSLPTACSRVDTTAPLVLMPVSTRMPIPRPVSCWWRSVVEMALIRVSRF